MNRRNTLFALIALGAAARPLFSFAQAQDKVWRVGLVHVGNDHEPPSLKPLLEGMRGLGYEEGRNVRYDFRNVAEEVDAVEAARAFVGEAVDVIVAFDNEAVAAAQRVTATTPIVMVNVGNPVAAGFAQSLARPGANITGFAGRTEIPGKEMEILREIAPKAKRILLLFDSQERASITWRADSRIAAKKLGFTLVERDTSNVAGIRQAFARLKPGEVEAVVFASNGIRHRYMSVILPLAQAHKVLMIAGGRKDLVKQGVLFSYGYNYAKVGRATAGRYLDRVLKGIAPRDLPIEEITEYELTVNGGVAKRSGLTLPQSILVRADVIE